MEISSDEFRRLIETGQIVFDKKGRAKEGKMIPEYKKHLAEKGEPLLSQVSFAIPCKLITLNEYILLERKNRFAAAKAKQKQTDLCALYAAAIRNKIDPDAAYNIKCHWVTSDKRTDSDNIYFAIKFILDGMVHAKVITDDNYKFIKDISHKREIVKGKNTVTVTLINTNEKM